MAREVAVGLDFGTVATPAFVVDVPAFERNLDILADVQTRAGCKILAALKGFALWHLGPRIGAKLSGAAASSPHEAQLAREHIGGEVHAYAPAYSERDMDEVLRFADHVVLNSRSQWKRFRERLGGAQAASGARPVEVGLRVNPKHSEVEVALYDPCAAGSRLGVPPGELRDEDFVGLDGLHFHTLCELDSDALERTLVAVERHFSPFFPKLRWVNMGGGHHITREGYDIDRLVRVVSDFRARHSVEVYLEPGEAVALGTGVLVASVLDVVHSDGTQVAILDVSATAHMPDVLEMPYRPDVRGAGAPDERAHTYRLAGPTCLAGDVIGDYSFDAPLTVGQRVVFEDMAHYTMVKTSFFNGVQHPDIALWSGHELEVVRRFRYEDFKGRLG